MRKAIGFFWAPMLAWGLENPLIIIHEGPWQMTPCAQLGCHDTLKPGRYPGMTFEIQQHEVTKGELYPFALRWAQTGLPMSGALQHLVDLPPNPLTALEPIGGLSLEEMQSYCQSLGGRLPTETEWMVAAGVEAGVLHRFALRQYPIANPGIYGNDIMLAESNGSWHLDPDTAEVDAQPTGIHRLAGMNGGVWEATLGPKEGVILKGGSRFQAFLPALLDLRIRNRINADHLSRYRHAGFRCLKETK